MTVPPSDRKATRTLAAVIVALFAASIAYRILVVKHLEHSSLVFVGIPALVALALLQTRPDTAIGTINKVIGIALCLSGVVFGEALVCILMAAPIFFLVGTLVGVVVNVLRGKRDPNDRGSGKWRVVVAIVVMPFGSEGVVPFFEFARNEQVSVTRDVLGDVDAVRATLAAPPRFAAPLPPFLRLGFPVPTHSSGSGLRVGDTRAIMFAHGEHHSGALVMAVAAVDSASVRFTPVSDASYITHWLAWQEAVVRLAPAGEGRTRVTWTLRYRRRLDPAWYFAPLERYGASLAAEYLIESLATPAGTTPAMSLPAPR